MIKANELRVGNYLYDNLEDCGYIKVLEIKQMDDRKIGNMSVGYIGINGGYCTTSLEEEATNNEPDEYFIQPIPLTEEILLKCGFKQDIDGSFQKNNVSIFLDKRFKTNLYLQTNDSDRYFSWFGYELKVEHLHQLQNLYFALTNEELKIEL